MTRRACLAAMVLLLGGCTVGPDFKPPAPPEQTRFTAAALPADAGGQHFALGADVPADWWTLFQSPPLTALIARALKANPDVQSAEAALTVAMENRKAQFGAYYPTLSLGLNASRNQNPGDLSPTLASSQLLYNLYQTQLAISWTPDIFGANRRAVEALQAQEDAQAFQLQSVRLALAVNIADAAVQEAALRAEIDATHAILDDEQKILDIEHRQYAAGEISGADVAGQESVLAIARQSLPPLDKQLAQQRSLLTALAGQYPADEVDARFQLSALVLPDHLPVSLPSQLVARRPDIRVAQENLHAASAQIGVAMANQLPNITLSADAGSVATQLGALAMPGNGLWNLGAGLAAPVLDGGQLLHRTKAARAAYEQASAQYRSTVITAFREVADALHGIQSDSDMLTAAEAAEQAAARTLTITQNQLRQGQIGGAALLNAEQTHQQAVIALAAARAARFSDTVALLQALGGGWDGPKSPENAGLR